MSHFHPMNAEEHERGNNGEDVTDLCNNCRQPFMEHVNSVCPGSIRRHNAARFGRLPK